MYKNKKKKINKIVCFSLIFIFITQISLINIHPVLAYQTEDDLETTINAELNSNTLEMKGSTLMTAGTHPFYETPELDIGGFEHDITSIDVLNIQAPSYTISESEDFEITDPTQDTNESIFLSKTVGEYTCDGGLDTIISLNIDYESNDNDKIEIFNEGFTGSQWGLYDMASTTIQYSTYPDGDTYVDQDSPSNNYGSYTYWLANYDIYNYDYRYTLIQKAIPYLYEGYYSPSSLYYYGQTTGSNTLSIYRTSYFNENTVTWNTQPATGSYVGSHTTGTGWFTMNLGAPYPYYKIIPPASQNPLKGGSKESGTKPVISSFLNKFYQNTGSGYFYMQTATNQETINIKSPVYGTTTYMTAGDHIILDCLTTSSEQLKLNLWNDGEIVKEYNIFEYGNTNYARHDVDITIDEYIEFDQMSINGKFDNTEYFKCWDITVDEYVGKNFFSNGYVEDFTYNVLGQNYTEDFELVLDEDNSNHTSSEGTYVFYFDSSMFSNRDEMDDVIIYSQTLNLELTMNIERDVNITVDARYSSNSWVVPSVVGLKINGEEVSDESTKSGFCALGNFPENLVITSTSQCYFRLDIKSLFSFTFDLDVISKTYLKKSFQLMSNHDINLTSIIFPETLSIKKIYLNNIDHDDDNPLTLNPKVEMATTSIFKLEVITYDNIYIPLDQDTGGGSYILYSENFGTDTSEMSHSYFFNEYEHDYVINGDLYMKNEFPRDIYEENWSDWDLGYNTEYTTSSFSNGTFSSSLNEFTNTSIPEQPEDFVLGKGSSDWAGDLSSIDGNYSTFTSTETEHYSATYSFTDDVDGTEPIDWVTYGTGGTSEVIAIEDSHKKVVEHYDNTGSNGIGSTNTFASQGSGTIEFWIKSSDVTYEYEFGSSPFILFHFDSEYLQYFDSVWNNIIGVTDDTWYYVRIDFECGAGLYEGLSADTYYIYLNGVRYGSYNFNLGTSGLTGLSFGTCGLDSFYTGYFDAVGYSWDPNYEIGGYLNIIPPEINFTTAFQLDAEPFQELKHITSIELFYSLKINITQEVNVSIYNFINSTYDLINSSSNFNNFILLSTSINQSCNINESRSIQFKFETINTTEEFHLDLEVFKIIVTYVNDPTFNNANITKTIGLDFLTEFDGPEQDDYQKIFNVSISIYYRFTSNLSDLTYYAYLNNTELNNDGEWVALQYNFEFNTTSPGAPNHFVIFFNITNGLFEINEMNYTIEFKCINLNGEYQIYQYFKLGPVFSITSNDITQEQIYLNFTCDFTSSEIRDLNYNNSMTNNILSYRINIQGESGWIYQDFGTNTTMNQYIGINLASILDENNQTTFQGVNIEFYLSGHESSLSVDTLNISILTNKIQLTEAPRTDINSVEFQEPMLASRSYTYWYFENSYTINDASLEDVETSEIITSFNIEGSKYFFQESFYGGDLILGLIDYNPGWDVSYEVLINNGTYTRMRIDYSADFTINNVNIVLNLKNDGILNDNWTLGTQDSYTFKLTISGINFTSTTQSFYIEGYSTIPYAVMSSYESDQNWNRIITENEIDYAGYLIYPKYTQVFLLNKSVDWTAYSVYYGGTIYSAETMNPSLVKVLGAGFDPDISDSYLYFRTSPFKSVDFEFDGAMITITINCSIDVENAYFMYAFDPSGVHNLAVYSSNNSISLQGLTDSGDFEGYLYFACEKIYSGITQIKIAVNFATPVEMIIQSVIIFVIAGIAIAGYYYIKRNEEKVEKLSKKIGAKLKEKLSRKKEEKGLKEISISIKDDKLYLEDKR